MSKITPPPIQSRRRAFYNQTVKNNEWILSFSEIFFQKRPSLLDDSRGGQRDNTVLQHVRGVSVGGQ